MNKRMIWSRFSGIAIVFCLVISVFLVNGLAMDKNTDGNDGNIQKQSEITTNLEATTFANAEDGLRVIRNYIGEEVGSLEYIGQDDILGFYEYESSKRFYSIDPISGEIMTVISYDNTPITTKDLSLSDYIANTPIENARSVIKSFDSDFFTNGAIESIIDVGDGQSSIKFEQKANNEILSGRIAGLRTNEKGQIIFLAFNISNKAVKESIDVKTNPAITETRAKEIAISKTKEAIIDIETGMNELNSTFNPDEKMKASTYVADNGDLVNMNKLPKTDFKVLLSEENKMEINLMQFRGKLAWRIIINEVKTSYDTTMKFWIFVDAHSGEIISFDSSL